MMRNAFTSQTKLENIKKCLFHSNQTHAASLCRLPAFVTFFVTNILLFVSCNNSDVKIPHQKFCIVTTTGMLADAARNIVGDSASVVALMGPGVDPHLYKASHGDLKKLITADMIIYNGLHLEGKMSEVFKRLSKQKKVSAASDGMPPSKLRTNPAFRGNSDPHIWFDVECWKLAVSHIGQQIMESDSANKAFYSSNLNEYLLQLDSLDAWVKHTVSTLPADRRVLITAHDAFGYFGDAYKVDVRGLQGISTLSDYGLNDITSLVNFISQRRIKAIFVESSVSPKSVEAVVEGCRYKGHKVKIGGTLYSDALGTPGSEAGNYVGMVKYNVRTFVNSLK